MTSTSDLDDLHRRFLDPEAGWGPMPFFWWSGGPVDRARLLWQLDQLAGSGIAGVVVGYSHRADSSLDADDPLPLTDAWWELFVWFVDRCAERGLTVGMQDYIVLNDVVRAAGADTPGPGSGTLRAAAVAAPADAPLVVTVPVGILQVVALGPDRIPVHLDHPAAGGELIWNAPGPGWEVLVITVEPAVLYGRPLTFDALHPDAGAALISRWYQVFADRLGDRLGSTFTLFFQDELDLGIRMPMWSARVPGEFRRRTGYELTPVLAGLWRDIGPQTATLRLDFTDVIVGLLEECYFEPVHRWHTAHRTTLAMDQLSRGEPELGRSAYGDYLRTMRWYGAPGNDDPKLHERRNVDGFKVNSSLAHLYRRPRVWNEAFHSSGWGTTPAQILAGLDEDFAYGATAVSLHGLYHTTHGGWWEWAAPDFHFRQPYWRHCAGLWRHITRMSWLLSQGRHGCDVAVLDPAADLDAAPAAVAGEPERPPASAALSRLVLRELVRAGCDADLIDDDSLRGATVTDGCLRVADESYRVLIVPGLDLIRSATLAAAERFAAAGGTVLYCTGKPEPVRSARDDRSEPGPAGNLDVVRLPVWPGGQVGPALLAAVDRRIDRTVRTGVTDLLVLHRHVGDLDIYLLVNAVDETRSVAPQLPARARFERWDSAAGTRVPQPVERYGTRVVVPLELQPGQSVLLVAAGAPAGTATLPVAADRPVPQPRTELALDGDWDFRIVPTMDNRFGDFRLPAGDLPPEAHELQMDTADGPVPVRVGHGPRLWWRGPLRADADRPDQVLATGTDGEGRLRPPGDGWRPYSFSEQTGIIRDPLLQDLQTGPHGLDGTVPDEFLDLGGPDDVPAGSVSYLWTTVSAAAAGPADLLAGSRAAYRIWLNGQPVLAQPTALAPEFFPPWDVPDLRPLPRQARVELVAGVNTLLVRFVHPSAARLRGYLAVRPPAAGTGNTTGGGGRPDPALRWWAGPDRAFSFDPEPGRTEQWVTYTVTAPPGLTALSVTARGTVDFPAEPAASGPDLVRSVPGPDGVCRVDAEWDTPRPRSGPVRLRVRPAAGCAAGAVFAEPIRFRCVAGTARLGDWAQLGLAAYSGIVCYRTTVELPEHAAGPVTLALGTVAATAAVRVNGRAAGTSLTAPYRFDVTGLVRPGPNTVEVEVANTLGSYFATLPTPYAGPDGAPAGLLGPVVLSWARS